MPRASPPLTSASRRPRLPRGRPHDPNGVRDGDADWRRRAHFATIQRVHSALAYKRTGAGACVCVCVRVCACACARVCVCGLRRRKSTVQSHWCHLAHPDGVEVCDTGCAMQLGWADGSRGQPGEHAAAAAERAVGVPWCVRDRDRCCAPCVCVIAGLRAAASLSGGARAVEYPMPRFEMFTLGESY